MQKDTSRAILFAPILFLLSLGASSAQDSLGFEVYDSVKIDLSSGVKTSRYMPFDVPFYLYGSSKGIDAIHLQMIESTYQACCTNPHEVNKDCAGNCCNCSCRSVTDQRLEFFRTFRNIERGKDLEVHKMLRDLREKKRWVSQNLYGIYSMMELLSKKEKATLDRDPRVVVSHYGKKDVNRPTSPDERTLQRLSKLDNDDTLRYGKVYSELWLNNILLHVELSDSIALLKLDSVKYSEFLHRNFRHTAVKLSDLITAKRINDALLRIEKKLLIDSVQYSYVRKHWLNAESWEGYHAVMDKRIKADSLSQCKDCNFNPKECNTICSWQRDALNDTVSTFFLQIPPLQPNHEYTFYFEILRSASSHEKNILKHRAKKQIMAKVDSLLDNYIQALRDQHFGLDGIRDQLLFNPNTSEVTKAIVTKVITGLIRDEYGSELSDIKIDIKGFTDPFELRALVNQMISHKMYRLMMTENYLKNDQTQYPLHKEIKINGNSLQTYKINFFRENKMNEYALLDTLNQLIQGESSTSESLRYQPFNLQKIVKNVPTGLMPHSNLQHVALRDLEIVNDFDIKTVNEYLVNLNRYHSYLQRVQVFLINDLIRPANGLRGKLFAGGFSTDMTAREVGQSDGAIRNQLIKLSLDLQKHQADIIRFRNIYTNYQTNLRAIQGQIDFMLDSLFQRNRSIQIAAARKSGGFSSANFKVRSHWAVTADAGLAFLALGSSGNEVTPYFGANFNFRPINRQAYYGLLNLGGKKRKLKYRSFWVNEHRNCVANCRFVKASSIVLGLTTTDLSNATGRENLISGGNLNLLLGYGIRITDATRFSVGGILLKQKNTNPAIDQTKLRMHPYFSLSIDIDVANVLGQVGRLLKFRN